MTRQASIVAYEAAMNISRATNAMTIAMLQSRVAAQRAGMIDTKSLQAQVNIAGAVASSFRNGSFWTNEATQALHGYGSALGGAGGVSDAQNNYNDLLRDTISMLKQQANDQKDALKAQLDGYKKIIDAKKKILDQMQEEDKYQDELAEKNQDLSDIDNELLQIQFDNSDEAKKRRLELEDEKAKKITEIDQFQADRSVEIQKDALDEEYDRYEKQLSKKISALDDYLKREGVIRAEAIALLESRNQSFYNQLLEWNRQYGTGIDNDITAKWNGATQAANNYGAAASSAMNSVNTEKRSDYNVFYDGSSLRYKHKITGRSITADYYNSIPKYHSGGIAGRNLSGGSSGKENEILANVLKEEVIVTENQAYDFIRNTLPNLLSLANASGETNVPVSIIIEGNVDQNVMPELKENITKAVYQAMTKRGTSRNASNFSI